MTEPYYPFRASAVEEFTVGAERCDTATGSGTGTGTGVGVTSHTYCNGPLKPNTKYYVKLRAFTAPDKYTDTQYTIIHTG